MLDGNSIFSMFQGNSYPRYANFITEIGEWDTPAGELEQRQQFCLFYTPSQPADDTVTVVIGKDECGYQRLGKMLLECHQHFAVFFRLERCGNGLEKENGMRSMLAIVMTEAVDQ